MPVAFCFSSHSMRNPLQQNYSTFILILFVSVFQRWVWAYRKDRILLNVNTNNGSERQNLGFKSDRFGGKTELFLEYHAKHSDIGVSPRKLRQAIH